MRELAWIDDFWKRAGPHIFSRVEDGVLILPPNRVYRTNPTAAALVAYLKRGGRARRLRLPKAATRTPAARAEAINGISSFFGDLASLYRGEVPVNGTVDAVPFDFSFTRLPVLGEIAVTYRCNNRCRFCYAGCNQGVETAASRRPERSTADLARIIDAFADRAKIPFFSFTGGEPLLRGDLELLCRHAKRRGLSTNLVTNGTLATSSRARILSRAGLGSAQVSIEAPDAALHDALVGRSGAFSEALAGITALQEAGIPVQTNTTITAANAAIAPAMPTFLRSIGISRFAMNLFIPTSANPGSPELFLPYSGIGPVVRAVRAAAREEGLTFYWYSPTPFCHFNPIAEGLGNKSCAAVDGLLSVAPDGEILPCSSWDEGIGNILEADFDALWFSPGAAFYKEKRFAPEGCQRCGDLIACQGACPLYWRFAGTGEIDGRERPSRCAAPTAPGAPVGAALSKEIS